MSLNLLRPVGYDAHSCGYCSAPGERSRKRGSRSFGRESARPPGDKGGGSPGLQLYAGQGPKLVACRVLLLYRHWLSRTGRGPLDAATR